MDSKNQKPSKNVWIDEYLEFNKESTTTHSNQHPIHTNEFLNKIKNRLFPNPWFVFTKLLILHALIGSLSLAICGQFGLNPFHMKYTLSDFFMTYTNHHICMILCGFVFTISTYFAAQFLLSLEEFEAVKKHEWLQTSALLVLSLTVFYFFGAELIAIFVCLWLLGAFIGSIFTIEISYYFRRQALGL